MPVRVIVLTILALLAASCTTASGGGGGGETPSIAPRAVDNTWDFSCAVDNGGQVYCWGSAENGQLGNGETTGNYLTPQPVPGIDDAVDVSTGYSHACALRESGSVWCWGENDRGQLGDNTFVGKSTPVEVRGLIDATSVAAGGDFNCARRENGRVVCWGEHYWGNLGAGVLWLFADESPTPLLVENLFDAVDVTAGQFHACARKSDGTAVCWGSGSNHQLGNGGTGNKIRPHPVSTLTDVSHISAGGSQTCAIQSQQVYCWGADSGAGASGDPDSPASHVPTPSVVANAPLSTEVESGSSSACALSIAGQTICWGSNVFGRLGNGLTSGRSAPFLYSVNNVSDIGLGSRHSCTASHDGYIRCAGSNADGEIGDGTTTLRSTPVQTLVIEPPTP